jgi:hypothetical protein
VQRPQNNHAARGRLPTFGEIDFGEDDANVEAEIARIKQVEPVFIRAFFDHPSVNLSRFEDGTKFLIHGQKGTGKTAIFRKLQNDLIRSGIRCSFIVFRDEVASKEELEKLSSAFSVKVNEIKKINHHLYVIERLILLIMASHIENLEGAVDKLEAGSMSPLERKTLKSLFINLFGKSTQEVIQKAIDSAFDIAKAVQVDVTAATNGVLSADSGIILRESNRRLFSSCIAALRANPRPLRVFIDEVHFSYKENADHDEDAALVRDLVRAVANLNKMFSEQKVDCRVFAAVRSEFLANPLISGAELHPIIEGFGVKLSWASFNADLSHPMFDIGAKRAEITSQHYVNGRSFMKACFANFTAYEASEFVQSTWSKPRDMVRFLRTCKNMFPGKTTLSQAEYRQVFRESCQAAYREIETAITSFLSVRGVERLKTLL